MSTTKTPYEKAFTRWHYEKEVSRKKHKLPRHKLPPNFPEPPPKPEDIAYLVNEAFHYVGKNQVLQVLQIDRSTLSRWLSGKTLPPHSAVLVLRFLAHGIPPGCSRDWEGFAWRYDRLVTATGLEFHAQELNLWTWHRQLQANQAREIEDLKAQLAQLRDRLARVGPLPGSSNDAAFQVSGG